MTKPKVENNGLKIVATNRKARRDYAIDETVEAGIALLGTEVKSLREGKASLADGYVQFEEGEAYLVAVHIAEYSFGNRFNHQPTRKRKLLLHKLEIRRLIGKVRERGLSLIPLQIYFRRGRAKVLLGLGKGKRAYDKREDIKRRDEQREIRREIKGRSR